MEKKKRKKKSIEYLMRSDPISMISDIVDQSE